MTSLAEERAEQQRWTARLRRPDAAYDRLLDNEFAPPDVQTSRIAQALGGMLRFAGRDVPHYRDAFARAGVEPLRQDPMQVLAALPALTKLDVQDAGAALRAENLPSGQTVSNWTESSGTTGRPTRVLHTMLSTRMFSYLKQREYRWFRFDPAGIFAAMRLPGHLPRRVDGGTIAAGETVRQDTWSYMANFNTGPFVGISAVTPIEERIAWLRRERPDYLLALSETLELVALAAGGEPPADSLKATMAISEQLTPGMRALIEERFGAPVHQNYGLNEIGVVAARCESGRYHVHTEHCLVEIADERGQACAPGVTGRILVTTLTNAAMPLLRYDTGDLAEAVAGECPCGRTLPAFGDIVGRYSRIAYLPPGAAGQAQALRTAIETMPVELIRDLREFQIHQYADKRFELRVVARAALPDAFLERVRAVGGPELAVVTVDEIPRAAGGKAEVFTSDFMPPRTG